MEKRLYKSPNDKVLAGVCGGLGEYLDVDPTVIRLGWVLFSLAGGAGLLAYIICALIVPEKPMETMLPEEARKDDGRYDNIAP